MLPSYFEPCSLACTRLLANLHLHFAFRQSKAMLPILVVYTLAILNQKL